MRCLLTLSLILTVLFSVNGQPPPATIRAPKGLDKNCIYKNKYSETERLKFYPFSVSDTIVIVSFRYHKQNYPIVKNRISYDSILEKRVLSKAEVGQFTDILYNNVEKKPEKSGSIHIASETMCFFPRNAILFIDKTGQLKEYLLLCFHCENFEASSDNIRLWDPCYQKFEMLRQFFISMGIKFGTDPTIDEYPGEEEASVNSLQQRGSSISGLL